MKAVLLGTALVLSMPAAAADVPDSIIGTWEFDPVRTMNEVFDRAAAEREAERQSSTSGSSITMGSLAPPVARSDRASPGATGAEPPQSLTGPTTYRMTITEDTITGGSALETLVSVRYKVVGGNAGLVVIESIDPNGRHSVSHVRLVEGGIAMDAADCEQDPDHCRQSRGGAPTQRTLDPRDLPKVLYFKRVAAGNADTPARPEKRLDGDTSDQ